MSSSRSDLSPLGPIDVLLLTWALVTLPLVGLLLKRKGFTRTEKFLARFGRRSRRVESEPVRVKRVARMVSVAAVRGPFNAQCLEQAISLWWMLGLMGITSTMRLGIYKLEDHVEAHAWVMYNDETVIGQRQELDSYTPLLDVNIDRR